MSGPVPVATSLADIYPLPAVATQALRWNNLATAFHREYGHDADFIARSPGRVNIIGEHIDYSLYAVLPMAITDDAIVAVRSVPVAPDSTAFTVRIRNVLNSKFAPAEFTVPITGSVDIDATRFEWTNYFKSGLRGALELLARKRGASHRPRSLDVLMDGTVPVGGGLSSSAAFVSASALAVMVANGEDAVDKTELTELAIVSERAVGVNSGGMDQAASVFSEQGSATLVSFSPNLSAHPVKFPPTTPELCFVIAQSFVTANKHVTGPIHYNLRVVEVTFAAAYLHALLNPPGTSLPADAGPLGISLHGFQETHLGHHASRPAGRLQELEVMIQLARDTLTREEGYTREEIAAVLGLTPQDLEERFTSKFPVRADRFMLRQRALHVFSEARRVLQFLALLEGPPDDAAALSRELGRLMNETQESCRELYECSCAEIDDICRIARKAGAYGSRLTGAGWGGCSVHLVPLDRVAAVREALEREYYSNLTLTEEQKAQAVVVTRPARGSAIYKIGGDVS